MVMVPPGEFVMGSPEGEGRDDEHPQHAVYLSEFWIDKTEVRNEQYGQCVAAGACQPSEYANDDRYGPSQAAVGVSWHDAHAYCEWAGKRLPTEAQWEKAARGTDQRIYPWRNEYDSTKLNFCPGAGCVFYTAPVGSYPDGASPYGAVDMAGNAKEWCQDWYSGEYYAVWPPTDPPGPDWGFSRIIRGGAWCPGSDVRTGNREALGPDARGNCIGFRCAADAPGG
jgi:formylglycine-generating enzyme required for sulfatase activity